MEQTMSLPASWSRGSLIAFRFFFVYFIFYIFPFPLSPLTEIFTVFQPATELSNKIYVPLAKYVMGVDYELPMPNGSGDTVLNYVQFFLFLMFSVAVTIVWSFVDMKEKATMKNCCHG